MAPKGKEPAKPEKGKDDKGKDNKGKDAKGKDDKKGLSVLDRLNNLLVHPRFGKIAMSVVAGMFALALLTFVLYRFKRENTIQKLGAVSAIRGLLVYHDESLDNLSDAGILLKTQELLDYRKKIRNMVAKLEDEITAVSALLQSGWVGDNGFLYYMSALQKVHSEAVKDCEERRSILVVVTSQTEQMHLVRLAQIQSKNFWIGLSTTAGEWVWVTGRKQTTEISFWGPGKPGKQASNSMCAEIQGCGRDDFTCWNDIACTTKRNWICKQLPNPHYMV